MVPVRCALRYDPSWGKEVFKAEKVLAHRVGHGKVTEYLVRWHGRDPATNRPWHDRWEPEENVSDDLIDTYRKAQRHVCDRTVRVNVKPAYEALRRTVANAVWWKGTSGARHRFCASCLSACFFSSRARVAGSMRAYLARSASS